MNLVGLAEVFEILRRAQVVVKVLLYELQSMERSADDLSPREDPDADPPRIEQLPEWSVLGLALDSRRARDVRRYDEDVPLYIDGVEARITGDGRGVLPDLVRFVVACVDRWALEFDHQMLSAVAGLCEGSREHEIHDSVVAFEISHRADVFGQLITAKKLKCVA